MNGELKAGLGISLREVTQVLHRRNLTATPENIRALCEYLRTTARDAAASALVDWEHNNIALYPETEENEDC